MRALANPVLLRAAIVLFCATFAFLLGLLFMRLLKQNIIRRSEIFRPRANRRWRRCRFISTTP